MTTVSVLNEYLRPNKSELRAFAVYGLSYALLNLLVPLVVQLLVSNLALTGLASSLFTLTVALTLGLVLLQVCRLAQIMLLEFLERKVVTRLAPRFKGIDEHSRAYYFELMSMPKSLSKWALDGFEIFLALVVGTLVLMIYHPLFIVLTALIWSALAGVYWLGKQGLRTALAESNNKYDIWHELCQFGDIEVSQWLLARAEHFKILMRQVMLLMIVQVVGSVSLMLGGALLFMSDNLSLGQFVSAELIGGGIFMSLDKLSKFMETHYSLMTNFVKVHKALAGGHHAG